MKLFCLVSGIVALGEAHGELSLRTDCARSARLLGRLRAELVERGRVVRVSRLSPDGVRVEPIEFGGETFTHLEIVRNRFGSPVSSWLVPAVSTPAN